jgi:hypothetical protein
MHYLERVRVVWLIAVYAVQANLTQCGWCAFQAVPRLLPAPLQRPAAACPDAAAGQLELHPQGYAPLCLLGVFYCFLDSFALEAVTGPQALEIVDHWIGLVVP